MHGSVWVYVLPFVIAAITGVAQWLAGPERAGRYVGLAFPVAFTCAWIVVVAPGWRAFDALGRIGHIVAGAALIGVAFDNWRPHRRLALPIILLFLIGTSWAEANDGLWPMRPTATVLAAFAALLAAGAVLVWRVDRAVSAEVPAGAPGPAALVLLAMAALALAAVAGASTQSSLHVTGLLLAAVIVGFLPWVAMTGAALPATMLYPAAAGLFALAWAIFDDTPVTLPGVALAALTLFADGTARRVPLPRAGISAVLYPIVVTGVAFLPLALAFAVTLALRRVT